MKKIFNLVLVIALLLIQILPVLEVKAESGTNTDDGKITIANTEEGRTYTIYQILQLESFDTSRDAYTYKATNDDWYSFLTNQASSYVNVDTTTKIVTWKADKEDATLKAFSQAALKYAKEKKMTGKSKTVEKGATTVEFTGLNLGYYLVDSSLGALCGLNTTDKDATVNEKNKIPVIKKEVEEDSTGTYGESNNATIGQVVNFKTTVTPNVGAENYVLKDEMTKGLTLDKTSIKVSLNGKNVEADTTKWTLTESALTDHTFEIKFANEWAATWSATDSIVVTYSAVLNKDAVISTDANENDTWLEYGDNHSLEKVTTKTYAFRFDLVKVDVNNNILPGATFRLFDGAGTDANEIGLVKVSEGVYRPAVSGETPVEKITAGVVRIQGLDLDTYYLEEVDAPHGYNKLTSRVEVKLTENLDAVVTTDKYTSGGVRVENVTGSFLPTTGGMGTVLFLTIGSIMVIVFGSLLVTKVRLSKEV